MHTDGFGWPSYWINNDLIQTAFMVNSADPEPGFTDILTRVLDPFRGDLREDLLTKSPDANGAWIMGFSPDLSRVISHTSHGIVLRDLQNGVDLWRDSDFYFSKFVVILWAPDSSMAMVANLVSQPEKREYFLIDRDGKTKRIIANSQVPYPGFYLYDFSWSPDSHYLVLSSYGETFNLLVYDVLEDRYLLHCPVWGDVSNFWSPDSQQIAFSHRGPYPLQVLDLRSGQVFELLKEGNAVGWSDKFPVQWP